ncbi:hypothetical protein F5Y16DRAFT_364943 [Xylariaceae sp. FL0255]|nr:hypothetical protein F5Y16DRAFT_364943 [Xylariaceae sp. FL0255]
MLECTFPTLDPSMVRAVYRATSGCILKTFDILQDETRLEREAARNRPPQRESPRQEPDRGDPPMRESTRQESLLEPLQELLRQEPTPWPGRQVQNFSILGSSRERPGDDEESQPHQTANSDVPGLGERPVGNLISRPPEPGISLRLQGLAQQPPGRDPSPNSQLSIKSESLQDRVTLPQQLSPPLRPAVRSSDSPSICKPEPPGRFLAAYRENRLVLVKRISSRVSKEEVVYAIHNRLQMKVIVYWPRGRNAVGPSPHHTKICFVEFPNKQATLTYWDVLKRLGFDHKQVEVLRPNDVTNCVVDRDTTFIKH